MLQVKIKFRFSFLSQSGFFLMACGTRGEFHEGSKKFSFSQKNRIQQHLKKWKENYI